MVLPHVVSVLVHALTWICSGVEEVQRGTGLGVMWEVYDDLFIYFIHCQNLILSLLCKHLLKPQVVV